MRERRIEPPGAERHQRTATWTPQMKQRLVDDYATARAAGMLRELAISLGVDLYELYNKAHRLGLSKQIRRR